MKYWLVKTEPEAFSIDDLQRNKTTSWDGVRNYQARNNLMAMEIDDRVFIYHSVTGKAIVGLARVCKTHYPDITDETGKFVAVDMEFIEKFPRPYSLEEMKALPELGELLKRSPRLSVLHLPEQIFLNIQKSIQKAQ